VHYLVMEHLPGQTLADRLLNGPLPLPAAREALVVVPDGRTIDYGAKRTESNVAPGLQGRV
jgi:hypothetical protein